MAPKTPLATRLEAAIPPGKKFMILSAPRKSQRIMPLSASMAPMKMKSGTAVSVKLFTQFHIDRAK